MVRKFYITTTIPYANGSPHIGFALEIIQADILARWKRLKGRDVFFLTGTDEHGTKNYQTAKQQGLTPKEFVDENSEQFRRLVKVLNISNDNFIRTTDKKKHWPGVIKLWKILEKKGDIYKKKYKGKYCSGCERFVTEKDLVNGRCPNHANREMEEISEENYFFRLSRYSDKIKKMVKGDVLKIYPEKWKNNFLALIEDGLQDVSFSRDKRHLPWGIPVPGDKNQVMYVWCDALTNYLTGVGFPDKKYKKYWPADIHVVGKDMLRFHTGIWPGMLLSAGLELPKEVIVHGFLTINGKKISKSEGEKVSPIELAEKYSADALRYFLARNIPFGDDGDFSEKALVARHNNELADKLGNLVSRVAGLIEKFGVEKGEIASLPRWVKIAINKHKVKFKGNIAPSKLKGDKLIGGSHIGLWVEVAGGNIREFIFKNPNQLTEYFFTEIERKFNSFEFDKILNDIFLLIDYCNWHIQSKKLWETKDKKSLYELKQSILKIAELLWPFIPESAEKIKKKFSAKKIKKGKVLFEKVK